MVYHEWSSGNNGVVEDGESWGSGAGDVTMRDGHIGIWYILGPLIVTLGIITMIVLNARWQARLTQNYHGDRVRIVQQYE